MTDDTERLAVLEHLDLDAAALGITTPPDGWARASLAGKRRRRRRTVTLAAALTIVCVGMVAAGARSMGGTDDQQIAIDTPAATDHVPSSEEAHFLLPPEGTTITSGVSSGSDGWTLFFQDQTGDGWVLQALAPDTSAGIRPGNEAWHEVAISDLDWAQVQCSGNLQVEFPYQGWIYFLTAGHPSPRASNDCTNQTEEIQHAKSVVESLEPVDEATWDRRVSLGGPHPEARQEGAELAASGWAHFSDDDPYVGPPLADAYVPVGQGGPPAEYDPAVGRVPVYSDTKRTALLGYLYSGIGFVPANYADSDAFTPAISTQIRIDAFGGCDPLAGESCEQQWVKPHLEGGE